MDAEAAILLDQWARTVTRPLTEDISALNHPTNHYNCASDQLPRSDIITPIFSVSFDGNRAASCREAAGASLGAP